MRTAAPLPRAHGDLGIGARPDDVSRIGPRRPPVEVEGAILLRSEGRRHWLQVPRSQRTADVVGRMLASYEVEDLTVEEPDIEDVVRRIYREGGVLGDSPSGGS